MFGRQLGLVDGGSVSVEYVADVGTCTAAEVEPASADDWEILSLNAGVVEERLLQQARVVAVGQPIVFWLSASTVVRLTTAGVTPKTHACCLLANDTEVIVAPRARHKSTAASSGSIKQSRLVCCMRAAADASVGSDVVYINPSSSAAQYMRTGRVKVGRAMPSSAAEGSEESAAMESGLATSDK
ncbi:Peroxisome biosynthesis protein pex1, partial [Coemansia sp. BCRC 34301]